MWRRPIALVNGRILAETGTAESVRFTTRVIELDTRPRSGDCVFDLDGAWVVPGLVNAHDHLELNHYGPWPGYGPYASAREWIACVEPLLKADAAVQERSRWPLGDRLFVGALKNLLAGVTTVAHHNPLYPELRHGFPIKVVHRLGWAHSFDLESRAAGANGEPAGHVAARHAKTPSNVPFVVHLAEGLDAGSRAELDRLVSLGCLTPNTVLVHGVALDERAWGRVLEAGASLVWCPASNFALFGCTARARAWLDCDARTSRHLAIGTDSRLTGARDLLEELSVARDAGRVSEDELLAMCTASAARVLRLAHAGSLHRGGPADLVVLPRGPGRAADALLRSSQSTLRLVVADGVPLTGDVNTAPLFRARRRPAVACRLDGAERLLDARLGRRLRRSGVEEPGLEVPS